MLQVEIGNAQYNCSCSRRSATSGSDKSSTALVVGLCVALGLLLLVAVLVAVVVVCRRRRNSRRLDIAHRPVYFVAGNDRQEDDDDARNYGANPAAASEMRHDIN